MLIRTARRVAVAVIGGTVVLAGIALIVLPGPAFVVIPAGLAILATEFAWAKWMLKRARERAASAIDYIYRRGGPAPPVAPDSAAAERKSQNVEGPQVTRASPTQDT